MEKLEIAEMEAEIWATHMNRARQTAQKLAAAQMETTLPKIEGTIKNLTEEELAERRKLTSFWIGTRLEATKISNLNMMLANIQISRENIDDAYGSLSAKKKTGKETLTGKKRALSGLSKDKGNLERAYKDDVGEKQSKIADLNKKIDLVGKDLELAMVNGESADITRLEKKKKNFIQMKVVIESHIENAESTYRAELARLEVAARETERSSTYKKATFEQTEDATLLANKALSFIRQAEVSCKETISLRLSRFFYLIKKFSCLLGSLHAPICELSDVVVLSLLALLPDTALEDRLEGFKMPFYIRAKEEISDEVCAEIEFISKGTIKVVSGEDYCLEIWKGRCSFFKVRI